MDKISFFAGAAVTLAALYAGAAVGRWVARRRAKRQENDRLPFNHNPRPPAGTKPPPPPPRNPSAHWQWHAMPCGTRIELAETGFWIELRTKRGDLDHPYHGYTPEGRRITWGSDLAAMKRYLEGEAAERAEFTPVPGWKP